MLRALNCRGRQNLKQLSECVNIRAILKAMHITSVSAYPATKKIPLPLNVQEINAVEKSSFSPQRNRDINGKILSEDQKDRISDTGFESQDFNGVVNLSGTMQSNVPKPCVITNQLAERYYTHMNMPGSAWRQYDKYIADESTKIPVINSSGLPLQHFRSFSTGNNLKDDYSSLTRKEKLKVAVKEYGSVVIVFHVGISLMSLGGCYLAVTSGIDFTSLLKDWGFNTDGAISANAAAPFVVAYAIHKVFAPVRITITLFSVPLIVRYLRRIGFMKPPKAKN